MLGMDEYILPFNDQDQFISFNFIDYYAIYKVERVKTDVFELISVSIKNNQ